MTTGKLKNKVQINCLECGKSILKEHSKRTYCSKPCRYKASYKRRIIKHPDHNILIGIKNRDKLRQYRQSHKEIYQKAQHKYRLNNPIKVRAQNQAKQIKIKDACEKCGSTINLHRHHEDYNKPLDIITLCIICHKRLHSQKRKEVLI